MHVVRPVCYVFGALEVWHLSLQVVACMIHTLPNYKVRQHTEAVICLQGVLYPHSQEKRTKSSSSGGLLTDLVTIITPFGDGRTVSLPLGCLFRHSPRTNSCKRFAEKNNQHHSSRQLLQQCPRNPIHYHHAATQEIC